MLQSAIVYRYTSPSGKVYIGQTINEKLRKRQHRYARETQSAFHKAIKKYGFDSFKYDVLHRGFSSTEELNEFESFMISVHDCLVPFGYNKATGGQGKHGVCDTVRVQRSETMKAYYAAHPRSAETIEKLRQAQLARMSDPAKREHLRRLWLGKKRDGSCMTGWKHTPETLAKLLKVARRRPVEQLSLSGELIKTWPSINDAANHVKCAATKITAVCAGRRRSCRGFTWRYTGV